MLWRCFGQQSGLYECGSHRPELEILGLRSILALATAIGRFHGGFGQHPKVGVVHERSHQTFDYSFHAKSKMLRLIKKQRIALRSYPKELSSKQKFLVVLDRYWILVGPLSSYRRPLRDESDCESLSPSAADVFTKQFGAWSNLSRSH